METYTNEEDGSKAMKDRIEQRKKEVAEKKALQEQEQLSQFASDENEVEAKKRALRERIEQRKRDLAEKKAAEEEKKLENYTQEEKETEIQARKLRETIEANKKKLKKIEKNKMILNLKN